MQIYRPAPAKLNLFLHVTGRRTDGYHNLQTVFQFLDYCDSLSFDYRSDARVELVRPLPGVKVEDDLVFRAATLLQQTKQYKNLSLQAGATIDVVKRLPIGGGLGGGSSNAATSLVALNELWGLNISGDQLGELGASLGADVPVFVHGRACWAEGIGDMFDDISLIEPWYVVLCPQISVSTADVFQAAELTRHCSPITIRDFLNGQGENVFEAVVRKRYPLVNRALDALCEQLAAHKLAGHRKPAMTGTGASVFMACDTRDDASLVLDACLAQLQGECDGFVAQGKNVSPLFQ